jgi:hypothetical protein
VRRFRLRRGDGGQVGETTFDAARMTRLANRSHGRSERLVNVGGESGRGDEAFDDIVSKGGDLVVIQCKGAFLPIDARYSGKCEPSSRASTSASALMTAQPASSFSETFSSRSGLKRAKLWYRFSDEYSTLRNRKPPVGRALTAAEQERLFAWARTRPGWLYAYVASTLSFYCGLRACEIKVLRWQDIDRTRHLLHIRRSNTPAGWRSPTLNTTCLEVLAELHARAAQLGFVEPEHFVFPLARPEQTPEPHKADDVRSVDARS